MSTKPAIVFVPGAWHSPDGFKLVMDSLEAAGYETKGVHLPSVGASVPLKSFDPDVEAIQAAIKDFADQGKDVVLVVHSYGGITGSQAVKGLDKATREKEGQKGGVSHIFFCCAFALPENTSLMDCCNNQPLPWFQISQDQLVVTPATPIETFYNDVKDPEEIVKTLKPHSYQVFFSKITYPGWKYVPSTYLLCAKDAAIPLALQQTMVDQARSQGADMKTVEIDASHSPFLSIPEEMALTVSAAEFSFFFWWTAFGMDVFLGKVTQQAVNYAIRSGVAVTASYAIRQSSRLLAAAPKSRARDEVDRAQLRLQHKIRIISPAIDMIELIAARGNTSLETAINLTKELRREIQKIGQHLAQGAENAAKFNKLDRVSSQAQAAHEAEMLGLRDEVNGLIRRIDDAVPLINLAITTSGVTLSATLPSTVSPSRLLQASTFLTAGDTQYCQNPNTAVQIGPTFFLTVYMLFAGHNRPQNEEEIRETTWKEVVHKARVKLRRVPLDVILDTGSGSNAIPSVEIRSRSSEPRQTDLPAEHGHEEYAYQLMMIEDFDDDRMHDFEEDQPQPGPFDDVGLAGIREMIPIHEISKIFYADTSKVLNISTESESHHPVLLLKRDMDAIPPRRMVERENEDVEAVRPDEYVQHDHDDPWRLPPSLDPEWMAFEVYTGEDDDDTPTSSPPDGTGLVPDPPAKTLTPTSQPPWVNALPTSLSLLELLLRLCSLQQFQQQSHLSITDELLNFFLEEAASTGAGGNEQYRQEVRREARRRVGWDPYDESPIKRRGEDYQYQYPASGGRLAQAAQDRRQQSHETENGTE
ncbi:hypothetical protein DV737_g2777, partial [Chaetothyriales sp. CBS 132003]